MKRFSASRAFILPVVLVLIGLLSLMAAGFVFFIRAEMAGTISHADGHQARLAAESGLEIALAVIRVNRDDTSTYFDVPQRFRHQLVSSDSYRREDDPVKAMGSRSELLEKGTMPSAWRVSIVGPNTDGPPDTMRYGITPESSRLNINAATDAQIEALLGPIMAGLNVENPQELINALLDWLDPDDTPRDGGAENEFYAALTPPYQAKNGPLNTIEELLLIRGFNAVVLNGEDVNRNGILDKNEDDGDASFPLFDSADGVLNPGIAPYITVWSREPDTSLDNKPRINLNSDAGIVAAQIASYIKSGDLSDTTIAYITQLKQQGFNFSQWPSAANLFGAGTELDNEEGGETEQAGEQPTPQGRDGADEGDGDGGATPGGLTPVPSGGKSKGTQQVRVDTRRGGRGGTRGGGGENTGRGGGGAPSESGGSGAAGAGQEESQEELMARLEEMAQQAGADSGARTGAGRRGGGQGGAGGRTGDGRSGGSGRGGRGGGGSGVAPTPSPVTLEEMAVIMDRFSTRPAEQAQGLLAGLTNINTAPLRVLELVPDMPAEAAAAIVASRGQLTPDAKRTIAWPLVSGTVDARTFRKIAPHITTKSYQFHVEALGYADHVKLAKRYEWVIEMIGPLAQVKYHRDLTPLGRAWPIDDDDFLTTGAK